jgi:hypothetical protein
VEALSCECQRERHCERNIFHASDDPFQIRRIAPRQLTRLSDHLFRIINRCDSLNLWSHASCELAGTATHVENVPVDTAAEIDDQ